MLYGLVFLMFVFFHIFYLLFLSASRRNSLDLANKTSQKFTVDCQEELNWENDFVTKLDLVEPLSGKMDILKQQHHQDQVSVHILLDLESYVAMQWII